MTAEWGLHELPVTEWHGLVFVDESGMAGPLADCLGSMEEHVAPYEMERLVVAGQHDYDSAANWKILTENYHECYHCPSIHPELCKVSPPRSGENYSATGIWVGGWMDLRDGMATMSLDGASSGVPLRGLDPAEQISEIVDGVIADGAEPVPAGPGATTVPAGLAEALGRAEDPREAGPHARQDPGERP